MFFVFTENILLLLDLLEKDPEEISPIIIFFYSHKAIINSAQ